MVEKKIVDDIAAMGALGADAQDLGARCQAGQVSEQVMDPRRLGLNAVKGEEGLTLAGAQGDTVHDGQATELACIRLQVEMAGREAARRMRQGQVAVGEDLGLDRPSQAGAYLGQGGPRYLGGHDPASGAGLHQEFQGLGVEDVERRPGDPIGHPGLGEQAYGAHVVGLDPKFALADDLAQGL